MRCADPGWQRAEWFGLLLRPWIDYVRIFSFFGRFFTGTSDYVHYCGYIFFVWFFGALADSSDYVCGGDFFHF
jgi:hypothetical protein